MGSILILDTDIEQEVNFIAIWDKFFSEQCNLLLSPLLEINETKLVGITTLFEVFNVIGI
jgi:hypothetical protein